MRNVRQFRTEDAALFDQTALLGPLESFLSEYQRRVDRAVEAAELYATGVSTR